ncbi:MAG: ribosomal protein [Gammaproteobacteria bacterium]|jgi:small subunit ribosomal protein S1|nr:ribosomal protein [Gammaproteobacteria bacterium]
MNQTLDHHTTESFAELFESTCAHNMRSGDIVRGRIVHIGSDWVTVSGGAMKSEGLVPIEQFRDDKGEITIKVGDEIIVAVETFEDGFGETRMSRERAKRAESWEFLQTAHETSKTVLGIISGKVKGGFTVELNGVRAFLPGSLVDVRPVRDTGYLEGKELEFKVIKIDRKRNNVVVSRRSVMEKENSAEREALLQNIEEGQEVKGIVKNLTDYGAFIDLGGIDGLLHITDMSWKRIKHPSEIIAVGEELLVKVLRFDKERSRVSLGLKQLGNDPWEEVIRRYPLNTRLRGTVTNVTDYGCFVEIEDGVEGLVHMSEMDWTNKNIHPNKVVQLGMEVEVMVLEIDEERRRISLGLKQCKENPWDAFANVHQVNERIKGQIKSITDFGIFIGLEGNIDGLVHLSDISWEEAGEQAVRQYKRGQEIEAVILAIDPERERISLGIKQLNEDAFTVYTGQNPKGSIVTGKVVELDTKHAMIALAEGITGKLRSTEIDREKVEDVRMVLTMGESVEAKIMNIDKKNREITLSVKAKDIQEEANAIKEYTNKTKAAAAATGTTLGDLLKEQIKGSDNTEE